MTRKRENYPDPSTLATSELVIALIRWEPPGGSAEHEPRLRAWLEACVIEIDKRIPIPRELVCETCGAPAFSRVQHVGDECGRFTLTDPKGCRGRLRREIDR